jgi:hypothetical protein
MNEIWRGKVKDESFVSFIIHSIRRNNGRSAVAEAIIEKGSDTDVAMFDSVDIPATNLCWQA